MLRTDHTRRALRSLVVAIPVVLGMAGHALAQDSAPRPCPQGQPPRRIVYRPIISQLMRPKTLYLSNYAGVNYPPLSQWNRIAPTSAWTQPGSPFGWFGGGGR